jgi:hypothetical protein
MSGWIDVVTFKKIDGMVSILGSPLVTVQRAGSCASVGGNRGSERIETIRCIACMLTVVVCWLRKDDNDPILFALPVILNPACTRQKVLPV